MNYFEIINAVLAELNYDEVSDFADLTKLEHKRLKNIINRLNKEICNLNSKFYFRQIVKKVHLHSNKHEYNLDILGKINKVIGSDGEYTYETDYGLFYSDNVPAKIYSLYGQNVLFSPSDEVVRVFYSTDNFVIAATQAMKSDFELETDKSIIPDNFVERLFVNGAAYLFKQNSSHPKYSHWKNEYQKALQELLYDAKKKSGSELIIEGGYRKL